jgi:zinc-ribbon domain
MDLSKLPRLSKSDTASPPPGGDPAGVEAPAVAPPPAAQPAAAARTFCLQCGAPLRAGARFCDSCGARVEGGLDYAAPVRADAGVGAEVWLSAIIGFVLMLLGRSFGGYLLAKATGQPHHTNVPWTDGPNAGQEVAYWQLDGFTALNDSAIWLFGVAMVLEAIVLAAVNTRFKAKVGLLRFALFVTLLATAYNLFVAVKLLGAGVLPLLSLLAVGFGGYIAVFEWRLLQQLRPPPRANIVNP